MIVVMSKNATGRNENVEYAGGADSRPILFSAK